MCRYMINVLLSCHKSNTKFTDQFKLLLDIISVNLWMRDGDSNLLSTFEYFSLTYTNSEQTQTK